MDVLDTALEVIDMRSFSNLWYWIALATLLFAATEWAQTGIPGRTPDLSPTLVAAVSAIFAAGMLAGSSRARARSRAAGLRSA